MMSSSRLRIQSLLCFLIFVDAPAASPQANSPEVTLNFSDKHVVDEKIVRQRDPRKAFFFSLYDRSEIPSRISSHKFTVDIGTSFRVWLDTRVPPGSENAHARSLAMQI